MNFAKNEYAGYQSLCGNYLKEADQLILIDELESFQEQDLVDQAELEYQKNLDRIPVEIQKYFYGASKYITTVQINNSLDFISNLCSTCDSAINYINRASKILISKGENNLFSKLADLACTLNQQNGDINLTLSKVKRIMDFINQIDCISKEDIPVIFGHFKVRLQPGGNVPKEKMNLTQTYTVEQIDATKEKLKNSTDKLIAFSEIEATKGERFKQLLSVFASFKDKFSSDDDVYRVRKEITKIYLELFELIAVKTVTTKEKNLVVDLFLDFGYVDEKLMDESQLLQLVYLKRDNEAGQFHIFTIREWLEEIYQGKAEPSKNEFDLDYAGVLRDMKKSQHITEDYEKEYMADRKGKILFEIRNMFTAANKMTNGKVLIYCPILHKESLSDSIDKLIISKSAIQKAFEELMEVDYSLFRRSILYRDVKYGIEREFIEKEVFPIIILMPNIGLQGSMWQETSGAKKDTPARFALPTMINADLSEIIVMLAGRYRWEICKNIQGVYWSDITEKSLTSEYYDYVQFYRKNRELTAVAKDKIKLSITKARNNFREVFVQDYIQWVRYEYEGNSRLNKIVRAIMMTYCPFKKEVRQKLKMYPAFGEVLDKFETQRAIKIKKIENAHLAITRNGGTITPQLEENLNFNKL